MADAPNEELAKGLKSAKKKARNFVMVVKGTKVLHLIVSKKSIKAGEKAAAKSEHGGTGFVEGVVIGEGAELVFKIQGEPGGEPSVKISQLKEYVDEQTGLKIKPRFAMVSELDAVDEAEDEGGEDQGEEVPQAPPLPPTAQGKAVPPPPPLPPTAKGSDVPPVPPPPPADEFKGLIAAMNKLADPIKAAAAANPAQKGDLLKQVAAFQGHLKASDAAAAKGSLLAIGALLKQMTGTAPPVAPPPPPTGGVPEPPTAPPPPDRSAVEWEREFARLEPRYLAALKNSTSDTASKLRVVFTYATEQAEARAFDKALASLKRLEPLLDAAEQAPSGAGGEIEKGIVEKRKFLLTRFKEIPSEVRPSVNKLKEAIAREVPDEDSEELAKAIEEALQSFYDEIQDEVDQAITAGDSKVLAGLKNRVMQHELIEHLSTNPLADGTGFRESLLTALDEIEQKLAS